MSAKAVSYAAVLRNAAVHADIRARDAVGPRTAAHCSAEAAALRVLAVTVERIEAVQRRIDEWRETAITGTMQMREPLTLLELIAAGYTPPEDGPR